MFFLKKIIPINSRLGRKNFYSLPEHEYKGFVKVNRVLFRTFVAKSIFSAEFIFFCCGKKGSRDPVVRRVGCNFTAKNFGLLNYFWKGYLISKVLFSPSLYVYIYGEIAPLLIFSKRKIPHGRIPRIGQGLRNFF